MLKNAPKPPGRKIAAKWINKPELPNLYDRMFGDAINSSEKEFKQITQKETEEGVQETK
jgi:hypothetical protein